MKRAMPGFAGTLDPILNPASVAVVGANENVESFSGAPVANLLRHDYTGSIYPVNPRRDTVLGLPAFDDLATLPEAPELVVVVVRADLAVPTLHRAVGAGAKAAIVVSSGFGEGSADEAGHARGRDLRAFLTDHPIPVLGPSTTGLINLNDGFVPRAAANHLAPEYLAPGPVALVSQSGAANNAVFNRAHAHGVRIGIAIATGVQVNASVWDFIAAVLPDPRINVVCAIVEDLGEPAQYEQVARSAAAMGKSIVLLRTGRSSVGKKAVATHTDSLAGNWAVEREFLNALGVILVDDLDQLWEVAAIVEHWGPPPAESPRLGVIGLSGGEGALIADLAAESGLAMPAPSDRFADLVRENLALAGAGNPFDPTGEASGRPDDAVAVIGGFFAENDYDVHLIALNAQTTPVPGSLAHGMLEKISASPGRKAVSWWEVPHYSDGLLDALEDFPGPVIPGSHRLVEAVATWARSAARPAAPSRPTDDPARVISFPEAGTTYWEAREVLRAIGIPFAAAERAESADDAVRIAERLGYPVVMKADVPSTEHKAARGLIALGVPDELAVRATFARLRASAPAVVVETAVMSSLSLLCGTTWDSDVGNVVVVGSGGGATEYLGDTALCPTRLLDRTTALDTLARSRIGQYLIDREPSVAEQAVDVMVRLADAVRGEALSVDLNPLVVTPGGLVALDARIDRYSTAESRS